MPVGKFKIPPILAKQCENSSPLMPCDLYVQVHDNLLPYVLQWAKPMGEEQSQIVRLDSIITLSLARYCERVNALMLGLQPTC